MPTPYRLTTPRRLFPTTATKKYVVTGNKRRRITRYTPKSSRTKRRTVREIVQDMSMEKKKNEVNQSLTNLHSMNARLVGDSILTGVAAWSRIGDRITLTGIGINGNVQNASNPISAFGGNIVVPITLKIYVVQTTRNESPIGYWFQGDNSNNNNNYNTGYTLDPTGDVARSRAKMNLTEIKILARKSVTVYPKRDIQQNFQACKNIKMYCKLKKPVVIQYNTDSAVTPYGASELRPNIWICIVHYQPDTNATPGQTLAQTNLTYTAYYRE